MAEEALVEGLLILDPTTGPEPMQVAMAVRPDTLDGKVVGFLDNGKDNADKLLDLVAEIVAKRHKLAGAVRRRKPNGSKGAPPEMLDEMAEECDVAIVGVGD